MITCSISVSAASPSSVRSMRSGAREKAAMLVSVAIRERRRPPSANTPRARPRRACRHTRCDGGGGSRDDLGVGSLGIC